jgi:hypothetical protein
MQIADKQQLNPAEGLIIAAVTAEDMVNPVQQVGPDHADFVDDQQIEAFNEIDFIPVEFMTVFPLAAGDVRSEGHLEKGVKGDTAGVNRRHPGGGGDDHPFRALLFDAVEKGGLAGSGLAGEKDVAAGVPDKFIGKPQQRVIGIHWFFFTLYRLVS